MTWSPETPGEIEHKVFGAAGATRTVVVLRTGSTATVDPDPAVTATRAVRVVAVGLTDDDLDDPGAFRGETPAESTGESIAALIRDLAGDSRVGVVACGTAGALALRLAADLGTGIDRLALVAVPAPETPLDRDTAAEVMARVTAKTLIMNGQRDPDAAAPAARFLHDGMPGSRVEMVPGSADAPDDRLALPMIWDRVLSHVAPRTKLPA